MHHSSEYDRQMKEQSKEFMDRLRAAERDAIEATREGQSLNLGPTGRFPEGKLTDHDEGEIRIAIGTSQGKVVIDFGKPVTWIGFDPKQARELAESLRQQSYKAQGK